MTLARTYLEMGMTEEAIAALTEASRDADATASKRRRCSAGCIGKRSDLPHAVEWLERAAEAPAPERQRRARAALRSRRDRSRRSARRRARWRCSSSSRPTPATIVTCRRGSSASPGSRPEADHSYPEPAAVRRVFPRGRVHPRRRAVVGVLGAQSLRPGASRAARRCSNSPYARGAVTGVGVITALAGLVELGSVILSKARRRDADPPSPVAHP